MTAQAVLRPEVRLGSGEVVRIWLKHLTSLLLPVNALVFLFSGPHAWYVAPVFVLPLVLAYVLDTRLRVERRQPVSELPAWPFDALVYLLAGLQLAVVFGIARMFAVQDVFSVDMVVLLTVVGGSSGFAIITAHELIHRPQAWERQLGRLLLCSVLQEHFFTEHLRGHHVRIGLADDPATARFGESYRDFYRRTVPGQFRSAWQLEKARLARAGGSNLLRNRVLQGLFVGWGMALAVGVAAGFAGFLAFLLQAFLASRLLEAVNYFEHWGLSRKGSRVRPQDSWDTHSWFTYYGLTGLSRHADHHYQQSRPFQQLRVQAEVPVLPKGYVAMVDMVMSNNDEFQQLARAELRRRGLGPFEDGQEPEVSETPARNPSAVVAAWRGLSAGRRGILAFSGAVLAVTAGARLVGDSLPAESLFAHALLNAWILAAFLAMFWVARRLETAGAGPLVSWAAAVSLLVAVGRSCELLLSRLA
jgi:alkane 1-monooxygenase